MFYFKFICYLLLLGLTFNTSMAQISEHQIHFQFIIGNDTLSGLDSFDCHTCISVQSDDINTDCYNSVVDISNTEIIQVAKNKVNVVHYSFDGIEAHHTIKYDDPKYVCINIRLDFSEYLTVKLTQLYYKNITKVHLKIGNFGFVMEELNLYDIPDYVTTISNVVQHITIDNIKFHVE